MSRMQSGLGALVGAAVAALLLAACQSGGAVPGQTAAQGGSSAPPVPGNADLSGTIEYKDSRSFTNPPNDPAGNGSDESTVTVHVAMARVAGTNEFADAGSTFSPKQTSHRDVMIRP